MDKSDVLSVMIVEDSLFFADLILRILRRNGLKAESRVVATQSALQDALNETCWDVILSDNVLPGFSALEALNVRNVLCSDTPFVIVSDDISQKDLTEAFENGCSFFLPKDRIKELPEIIRKVIMERR